MKFTYPFCYVPRPEIKDAADALIRRIDASPELKEIFGEGKMLGVLEVEGDGEDRFIYAFSGLAGGRSIVEGFVPPVYDLTDPSGYYKQREAEISAMPDGLPKSAVSQQLQKWIFDQYEVPNALGEMKTINRVFSEKGLVPPGGTGDCALPKLLNYAYRHDLRPLAMGEFWYGESPQSQIRKQGCFYPSCTGKCGPLLAYMLRGLDVEDNPLDIERDSQYTLVYQDDDVIVCDKPSGLLCVPGKIGGKSLLDLLEERFNRKIYSCHRLDMDTSGLIVYARTAAAQSALATQFEDRQVYKTYMGRLTKGECAPYGRIELPIAADYYDRPRQTVDYENGKPSITEYRIVSNLPNGESDVEFTPLTGRTHQLRVHSAHIKGLGRPIKGDRLYGDSSEDRLYLHCNSLKFKQPTTGETLSFVSPAPWMDKL